MISESGCAYSALWISAVGSSQTAGTAAAKCGDPSMARMKKLQETQVIEGASATMAPKSLAGWVADALSDEILSGRLLPGQRVDLARYAARWNVSITPVRDAAKQLETQGFLKVLPRRGVFVSELTAKEVKDIFDIRIALECAAVSLATPLIPQPVIERALHLYVAASKAKSSAERNRMLPKIDLLIHSLALEYCGNSRLQKMMESIRDLVKWCQRTIILNLNEPFLATLPEHIAICEAVYARDPDRAAAAMRSHLGNTLQRILQYLSTHS